MSELVVDCRCMQHASSIQVKDGEIVQLEKQLAETHCAHQDSMLVKQKELSTLQTQLDKVHTLCLSVCLSVPLSVCLSACLSVLLLHHCRQEVPSHVMIFIDVDETKYCVIKVKSANVCSKSLKCKCRIFCISFLHSIHFHF